MLPAVLSFVETEHPREQKSFDVGQIGSCSGRLRAAAETSDKLRSLTAIADFPMNYRPREVEVSKKEWQLSESAGSTPAFA